MPYIRILARSWWSEVAGRRFIILEQDTVRGPFHVVVLTGSQGPEEYRQRATAKEQACTEQIKDDVHIVLPRSLKLLAMTSSDELDIAAAASHGVTRPAIASGTINAL